MKNPLNIVSPSGLTWAEELEALNGQIEYCKEQIKLCILPLHKSVVKEYQYLIEVAEQRKIEINQIIENIREFDNIFKTS